ncbi:BrkDBD domain containing protein [Trichuris trichiura]|uniref:BrkDBD domain containing protein n=1 Tax=Trichuris trichiura TaxID=36087 RepID=A0A077ZEW1_TRITR|nr:BrkDBD domain containing protein [Trichuris trichiura]
MVADDVVNPQSRTLFIHPAVLFKADKGASFGLHFLLCMTTGFSFIPLAAHDSTTVNAFCMQAMTRKNYNAGFKLEVVKMAKESNNAQAVRKYRITRKMVINWRKQEEALKMMPKEQCARRPAIASCPELENSLAE